MFRILSREFFGTLLILYSLYLPSKNKCLCTITFKSWISEMRFHNLQFAHHLVLMSSNLIFATNNNSNKRKKKLSYARKFLHPKITSSWNQILIPPKPDPTRLKVLSKYSNIKPALPQHRTLAKPQKERPGPIWLNEAKLKTSREHHGGKGLHNASSVEKELKLMNAEMPSYKQSCIYITFCHCIRSNPLSNCLQNKQYG